MSAIRILDRPDTNIPRQARWLLGLLDELRAGSLELTAPNGEQRCFRGSRPGSKAVLRVHDWSACGDILRSGDIGFAEAYRDGRLDSPDLTGVLRLALQNQAVLDRAIFGGSLARAWYWIRHRMRRNNRAGSRRNVHAHYDLGNDFYRLWLDADLNYSSALFEGDPDRTLAAAQQAKHQRVFAALQLRAGMRLLEIGCGWGAFAAYAAERGVQVHGITISEAQLQLARQRTAGSPGVALQLADYRDVRGEYDAVASIEMFEAVGERYWPTYLAAVRERLRPGARALVQTITIDDRHFERYALGSDFIQQFIFPGGMVPSPERFVRAAARERLAVVDRHEFGRDYAETLRHWRASFERQLERVRALGFDEAFVRVWRLYLAYCEAAFDEGRTSVMQILMEHS